MHDLKQDTGLVSALANSYLTNTVQLVVRDIRTVTENLCLEIFGDAWQWVVKRAVPQKKSKLLDYGTAVGGTAVAGTVVAGTANRHNTIAELRLFQIETLPNFL
jgi:hypothetical protein